MWTKTVKKIDERELRLRFPKASRAFIEANCALHSAQPQRASRSALECALGGKKESSQRIVVRFTGYRVRLLDPDNFAGGCKNLLDGLRHAQLISSDDPGSIRFETEQEKVGTYSEERTVITILYP
jgi:hypothetical protein